MERCTWQTKNHNQKVVFPLTSDIITWCTLQKSLGNRIEVSFTICKDFGSFLPEEFGSNGSRSTVRKLDSQNNQQILNQLTDGRSMHWFLTFLLCLIAFDNPKAKLWEFFETLHYWRCRIRRVITWKSDVSLSDRKSIAIWNLEAIVVLSSRFRQATFTCAAGWLLGLQQINFYFFSKNETNLLPIISVFLSFFSVKTIFLGNFSSQWRIYLTFEALQ